MAMMSIPPFPRQTETGVSSPLPHSSSAVVTLKVTFQMPKNIPDGITKKLKVLGFLSHHLEQSCFGELHKLH
jgi:hypothetical protein